MPLLPPVVDLPDPGLGPTITPDSIMNAEAIVAPLAPPPGRRFGDSLYVCTGTAVFDFRHDGDPDHVVLEFDVPDPLPDPPVKLVFPASAIVNDRIAATAALSAARRVATAVPRGSLAMTSDRPGPASAWPRSWRPPSRAAPGAPAAGGGGDRGSGAVRRPRRPAGRPARAARRVGP